MLLPVFQDATTTELAVQNADIVDKIVSLSKTLHLEANEDVEDLVEQANDTRLKSYWMRKGTNKINNAHQRKRNTATQKKCQQATLKMSSNTGKSSRLWLQNDTPTKVKTCLEEIL